MKIMAPPIYFVTLLLVLRHLKEVFIREIPKWETITKIILLLFYEKLYGDLALH